MTDLGLVGIVDKGTYNSSATYSKGQYVFYGNSNYLCLADGITNVTPSNDGTNWKYLAKGLDNLTYSSATKTITIPSTAGSFSNKTVIFT